MNRFRDIERWAHDRNLIGGATAQAQTVKLLEECGEIAGGVARQNVAKVVDGIGDAVVVLTILAAQHGFTIEQCIETAWHEIKDRKGRMVNGVFIKAEDA